MTTDMQAQVRAALNQADALLNDEMVDRQYVVEALIADARLVLDGLEPTELDRVTR